MAGMTERMKNVCKKIRNFQIMKSINLFFFLIAVLVLSTQYAEGIQTKTVHYSVEHGLSQSTVNTILQDDFGQMWFGTRNGLNLFNGYEFEQFLHSPLDSTTIINNEITSLFQIDSLNLLVGTRNGLCRLNIRSKKSYSYKYKDLGYNEFVVNQIYKDSKERLWVAAREGIYVYDNEKDNFIRYDKINAPPGSANAIVENSKQELWLGTSNGLFRLNDDERWEIITEYLYNPDGIHGNSITSICFDRYDHLWVGTRSNGIFLINQENQVRIKSFTTGTSSRLNLVSNEIRTVIEDRKGRIWIGTKEGVNIYDPFSEEIGLIDSKIGFINSISQNSVYSLYEDSQGGIWIGTWSGGVNLLLVDYQGFLPIIRFEDNANTGPIGAVSSITELDESLWIGTENNGIIIMDKNWKTIQTISIANTNNQLRSNHIKKVYRDHNSNIWIGFYDRGIQIYSPTSNKLSPQLDDIYVYDITEYPRDVFWIASIRQLIKLDLRTNETTTFPYQGDQESTNQQAGAVLLIDKNETLWAGSRFGVEAYNISDEKQIYNFNLSDFPEGNSGMNIFSLAEDSSGTLWIGTNQGLYYLNHDNETKIHSGIDPLKQYIIYGIISERDELWLSTNNGIIQFHPETASINKYTMIDGLQSNEFLRNSVFNWKDHFMLFGGINGFNVYTPGISPKEKRSPKTLITEIEFNDKSGKPTKIFYPSNANADLITLPPRQHRISFRYAGIDYKQSTNFNYYYKLEGLSDHWTDNDQQRSVAFTNLRPGNYSFKVRAQNAGNNSAGAESVVRFRIRHPYYFTFIAFIVYSILISLTLAAIWRFTRQKNRIQNELKIEKIEHEKLEQLNELKTKFFMNVSHEFRTPLTVIHGPVARMLETKDYSLSSEEVSTMHRNTQRLIGLLDELLELRKVEKGKSKMKLEYLDLVTVTKDVIQLFQTIAYEKDITIEFLPVSSLLLWADKDKLEKILSNLLSNAIKFTSEQGKILIEVSENQNPMNEEINAEISVIDNGIGMSREEVESIFDRFETLNEHQRNPKGIGIGLSLTKELITLHHGDIKVDSEKRKGSAFTVILPTNREIYSGDDNIEFIEKVMDEQNNAPQEDLNKKEKEEILIVDDNRDIRSYVSGILKDYHLFEAESVEEAESILESNMPDIIISDIILPGKDGYEFCRQIKSDQHTSHIPVILMTAKGNEDNRVHGLELGADAFIPKPFTERILKVWVEKLIDSRRKMFDYYMNQIMFDGKKKKDQKPSMKDSFLETARKIIEKDITNPQLSVEMLSKEMNMSRSNLHLKFKAIINQTPSDFIRIIRLNHSAELLSDGEHNIVEAAYGSGFNSPSYFTKCFKQYFKRTPTEFIEQMMKS